MRKGRERQSSKDLSKDLLKKIGVTTNVDGFPADLLAENIAGSDDDLAGLLRERYAALKQDHHVFTPKQVVRWKPGLKNRRWPSYGTPCIVLEVLPEPLLDHDNPGSPYFREPIDMIVGLFVEDGDHRGDFLAFHACSERYEPWPDGKN